MNHMLLRDSTNDVKHVQVGPSKTRLLVRFVLVLFLFGNECRDVLAVFEGISDFVLEVTHGLEHPLFNVLKFCVSSKVVPLMWVILQIKQFVLGWMQEALHVLIAWQIAILITRNGKPIERSIRIVD